MECVIKDGVQSLPQGYRFLLAQEKIKEGDFLPSNNSLSTETFYFNINKEWLRIRLGNIFASQEMIKERWEYLTVIRSIKDIDPKEPEQEI